MAISILMLSWGCETFCHESLKTIIGNNIIGYFSPKNSLWVLCFNDYHAVGFFTTALEFPLVRIVLGNRTSS